MAAANPASQRILFQPESILSLGLIGVLIVMLVPLPPLILDLLLAANLSASVLLLLITLNTRRALDLAVFPSLLLMLTLGRLSLNVATTRLILLDGHAGEIVNAFGNFVIGGNLIVGLVIFLILIVIQFVVITKGAGRISEVAARFTLDALPGKQMSIDSELNSGLIDEATARQRRSELSLETEFYGSMDGASKFVRGDAIAGLLITAINLIGGITIGILDGHSFSEALSLYSILTIGDGLISQVPALIIAVAAAMLTTKATTESSIGQEIHGQLLEQEKPLYLGAGILGMLALVPGLPKLPFLLISAMIMVVARSRRNFKKSQILSSAPEPESPRPESDPDSEMRDFLTTDRATIEVGARLLSMINPRNAKGLAERIRTLRNDFSHDRGLWIPPIRVRSQLQLDPDQYRIMVSGRQVGSGVLRPDKFLAILPENSRSDIPGEATKEPAFQLAAKWIDASLVKLAEAQGHTCVDAISVLVTHLGEILKRNGHELLTRESLKQMLDRTREFAPTIVDELRSETVRMATLHQVLQQLAAEGVPLNNLEVILESVANHAATVKTPDDLTDKVREDLGRLLCEKYRSTTGFLRVIAFEPQLENRLRESVRGQQLALDPDTLTRLIKSVTDHWQVSQRVEKPLCILTDRTLRRALRNLLLKTAPEMGIMAYSEVSADTPLEPVAFVSEAEVYPAEVYKSETQSDNMPAYSSAA